MYSILSARKVSDYLETRLTVLILINFCLYTSVGFIKIKFLSGDNLDISYQKRKSSISQFLTQLFHYILTKVLDT